MSGNDSDIRRTPRDRFLAAVERRPGQGVSWDLGYGVTGFTRVAHQNLCRHLGIELKNQAFWSVMLQTVYPDAGLNDRICGDLRLVSVRAPVDVPDEPLGGSDLAEYEDEWGLVRRLSANGLYYDIVKSPLENCRTAADCSRAIRLPQHPRERAEGLRTEAEAIRESGYAVGASCFAGIFEMLFWLRGFRNAYLDFARDPRVVEVVMDHLLDVQKAFWGAICDELNGLLDVALLTEDLGTQRGPMISPSHFESIVRPRIAELIAHIKSRCPGVRILLHSCGAIFPFIPDLIEIGVDLLNPVQLGAAGMDPHRLKAEFGSDVVFHGAVDIQEILCHGSVKEVKEHVEFLIDVLGTGGGYVVAPSHCVQADVPPENIVALVDTVHEAAAYPGLGAAQ